jgi:hypothetical protein
MKAPADDVGLEGDYMKSAIGCSDGGVKLLKNPFGKRCTEPALENLQQGW